MKTPLTYQTSSYDCGPVSIINALRCLFEREEIAPTMLIHTYESTLDDFDDAGSRGRHGTSFQAMRHISRYASAIGQSGTMPIESTIVNGHDVILSDQSPVIRALRGGAVGIARVWHEDYNHYVLLSGIEDGKLLAFDSYLDERTDFGEGVRVIDRPMQANRIIEPWVLNCPDRRDYAMKNNKNADPWDPEVGEVVLFWRSDRPDWRKA